MTGLSELRALAQLGSMHQIVMTRSEAMESERERHLFFGFVCVLMAGRMHGQDRDPETSH